MLDQQVDDKGTDQSAAREIIRNLCESSFDGDAGKLAVALGRSTEQVQSVLEPSDDLKVNMKSVYSHYKNDVSQTFYDLRCTTPGTLRA